MLRFCLLVFGTLLIAAPPAAAKFDVCNQTKHMVAVALGHNDGEGWRSEGWWQVPAGGCATLLGKPLVSRYYYLYALHLEVGGSWDGDRNFCVADRAFSIPGRGQCAERGFRRAGFFEIDTGADADWTQTLSD